MVNYIQKWKNKINWRVGL